MKERAARLRAIKTVIKNERIESQEALLEALASDGFKVTQATLSRDLKLLKVGKISDGWHGYYYTLPGEAELLESEKSYMQDVQRGFLSIEYSGNIGVIHTLAGHADSVALAMDKIDIPEIIGTIAGDDTVFIVLKEGASRDDLSDSLMGKFPDIEF